MSEEWGLLHMTVRDGATKDLVPARIHIKRPDGTAYVPPCGMDDAFDDKEATS